MRRTIRPVIAIVFTAACLVAAAPSAPASAPAAPAPAPTVGVHHKGKCGGDFYRDDVPIGGGGSSKLG